MPPERRSDDFGSVLKDARERRGIALRQIADDTKISVRALEALERNDISQLPGGIFSRAFVRAYASQIGLDPEETVESFLRHFPHDSVTVGHPPSMRIDAEAALNAGPVRVLWPWAAAAVAVVVAAILFFLSRR